GQLVESGELLGLVLTGLGPGQLIAQLRHLVVQAVVLAPGVEGLTEPVDQASGGLQRSIGTRLDRAEDRGDDVLDPVERSPVALAVIEAEQCQRGGDEEKQPRPSTAPLLSIHVFLALTAQKSIPPPRAVPESSA